MQSPESPESIVGTSSLPQAPIILLRLPNWLGDGVMSTPCLELLFSHFPQARIYLAAPRAVLELFANDGRIAGVFIDESKRSGGGVRILGRFGATCAFGREIRTAIKHAEQEREIDIAITLTNRFFSALLLYASGARMRIGYTKGIGKTLGKALLTHPLPRPRGIHQVASYANLLSPIISSGLSLDSHAIPPLCLHAQCLDSHTPESNVDSRDLSRIGLNPGAAYGSAKCWEPRYFARLAAHLAGQGKQVVLYGVAGDSDLAEEIINQAKVLYTQAHKENPPSERFINACGKTSIQSLMSQMSELSAFITNDSGSMHIAAALGVPTLALFGPTNSSETSPWKAPNARILSIYAPCAPCKKRTCPIPVNNPNHHRCMRDLTPEIVLDALESLLRDFSSMPARRAAFSPLSSLQSCPKGAIHAT